MKRNLLSICMLISALVSSQTYSNGNLSTGSTITTGPQAGLAAPAGYTWSELQSTNTSLGASGFVNATSNFRLADDFTIPAGQSWSISSIDVFAYQTGATAQPFNQLTARIYSGAPATGTILFGDATTNIINIGGTADSFIYRASGTAPGTTRRIWKVKGNVTKILTAGTYWLDYQVHATNDSSAFFPLVTETGVTSPAGSNAQQFNATWSPLTDGGSLTPQALPFIITYVNTLGVSETMQYDSRVKVYPNPAVDFIKIDLPAESRGKNTQIAIYDMSGRKVKTFKISDTYDISSLAKGNYLIKINDGSTTKAVQLIKN